MLLAACPIHLGKTSEDFDPLSLTTITSHITLKQNEKTQTYSVYCDFTILTLEKMIDSYKKDVWLKQHRNVLCGKLHSLQLVHFPTMMSIYSKQHYCKHQTYTTKCWPAHQHKNRESPIPSTFFFFNLSLKLQKVLLFSFFLSEKHEFRQYDTKKEGVMTESDGKIRSRGLLCLIGPSWTVDEDVAGHRSNKADEILAGRSDSSVN